MPSALVHCSSVKSSGFTARNISDLKDGSPLLHRHRQHRVAVRQNEVMSAPDIRTTLLDVHSTLMKDGETGKLYRFPKAISESVRKIYRSLDLVRGLRNKEILSVRKYRNRKGIRSAGSVSSPPKMNYPVFARLPGLNPAKPENSSQSHLTSIAPKSLRFPHLRT